MERHDQAIDQNDWFEGCKGLISCLDFDLATAWMQVSDATEGQVLSSTIEASSERWSTLSAVRRWLFRIRTPLLVGLAYYLGAQFAFLIGTLSDQGFALFWPPNVILFCALLVRPRREWLTLIAAAFIAHAIAEIGVGMPVPQLLVAFVTNCLVALLNAYGVRRLLGPSPWLGTFQRMGLYILITAGISPAIAALGGAFVPILGGGPIQDYWVYWSLWYLANALPSVTLGPVLLILLAEPPHWSGRKALLEILEPVAIIVGLIAICLLSTGVEGRSDLHIFLPAILLLPLPLIVFTSIRYGEKGASGAILVIAITMTWCTLGGRGMFTGQDEEMKVLALQLFLTGLSIPILLLGAMVEELRNAGKTTRALAASLMRAQDEERQRIARDLHDATGQNLIAASLLAGRLRDSLASEAMPLLQELEENLKQSNRELRTVSYLLHPPYLDEAGLGLALRYFIEGFEERSSIQVDLKIDENLGRLAKGSELVVFRVVQEALTNVARHSGSTTAVIRLIRQSNKDGRILLTVEDFGKGMSGRTLDGPGPVSSGLGLISMRERLAQIGGRLQIESLEGHTLIQAVIPIY
jgi:signal transduction histidine kinase